MTLSAPPAPRCHPETDTAASTYGIPLLSPRTEHTPLLAHASPPSHSWERLIAWGSDLVSRTHPSHKGPPGTFRQVKATPQCSPSSLRPLSQPTGP